MDAKVSCAPAGTGSGIILLRLIRHSVFCISFPPVTAASYDLFTCSVFLKIQN